MLREVVVVRTSGNRAVHVGMRIPVLAEGEQDRAVVDMEHAAAHDGRLARVIGEVDGADDGFRLADGIVVQQLHIVAGAGPQGFVHATRVSAGAAQVGLTYVGQLPAEGACGVGEAGLVAYQVGALVHAVDGVQTAAEVVVRGDGLELVVAVRRPVERGDGDGGRGCLAGVAGVRASRSDGRVPFRVADRQRGIVVGLDVEPIVSAVDEPFERQDRLDSSDAGGGVDAQRRDGGEQASSVGFEHDDAAFALGFERQPDAAHVGPSAPIAGGEGVEERAERYAVPSFDGNRPA